MSEDQNQGAFVQYDEDGDKILDPGALTSEEKIYFEEAKQQHRRNMTKVQKIGSRIFKGKAFIAKPSKIQFKDFTVGKPYSLIVTLTNVSNAFNSFNILPLPEKVRNFFEIEYIPKGKISPGITSDIKFKFFPQLNQDIYSEFSILAETGQISFPIVCTSKKTIVRCSNNQLDIGRVIYGESGHGKLRLFNEGTLPSELYVRSQNGLELEKAPQDVQKLLSQFKFQRESEIAGNSQKFIHFEFQPADIGFFEIKLQLYIKNFEYSPPIEFEVTGCCVEVPVSIEKSLYDFQICLLGHVYRQKLVFYSKSQTSMSFKVLQPLETRKYFEFNPVIGYIQKESKIQIWVKFSAEKDMATFLGKYQTEPNVYVIPFHLSLKEQVLPVNFDIKARITNDKVIINPAELNFGTIFEGLSSKIETSFENESELPQQILLYPLKKQISIENDQPLFKLLPKQKIKTFIIYRSKKLEDNGKTNKEEGVIPCKIITGDIATKQVKLEYSCEIIRPDLLINNNKIDLPALQVDEICYASTVLKNNANKRIIYEIFPPHFEISGLKITPVVKELHPKQEVEINIEYHSFMKNLGPFTLKEIDDKAKNLQEQIEDKEKKELELPEVKKQGKKQTKKETKLSKAELEQLELEKKRLEEEEKHRKDQEEIERLQIEKNFDVNSELAKIGGKFYDFGESQHYKWLLPVYFKQKEYPDASAERTFIEITTTSTKKTLIVDSAEIDFGQIAVGGRAVREIVITNFGEKAELKKKQLPIFCCYNVLNSMKTVESNGKFRVVVEFQPIEEQKFQYRLVFYTDKYTVSSLLKGKGVRPEIEIEPDSGVVPLGGVLLDESIQKSFKIKNKCNFEVNFDLRSTGCGVKNTNSSKAIKYIPTNGVISANQAVEVKVKFKPDRIHQKFFERIKIHVPQQKHERYVYVSGACYPRQAYVKNYKPSVMPPTDDIKPESPFDWLRVRDEDTVYGPNNKTILLEFEKLTSENKESEHCYKQKITVGSCKLLDPKLQKPTNFEVVMPKDDRFQCDTMKGATPPGNETVITFTYKPQDPDPFIATIPLLVGIGQWKELKAELKLSGGFLKTGAQDALTFDIVLRVYSNQL